MTEFKVGDIVSWQGAEGRVHEILEDGTVIGIFCGDVRVGFESDGKLYRWHKEPSLKFVRRPDKKVTKYLFAWRTANGRESPSVEFFESEEALRKCFRNLPEVVRLDWSATEFVE